MKISEVFASIQGEGLLSGIPSLFIRVSGCNLRCVWCDTPYTSWTPEGEDWSVERILEWAGGFPQYRHVVLTGGEPMLFPESVELTHALRDRGLHITVETAGTVWQNVACDLMSVSPKLANSTPTARDGGRWAAVHDRLRLNPEVLRVLTSTYEFQLKFVVSDQADLEEVRSIRSLVGAPPDRVLLMPEGVEPDSSAGKAAWLVEICKAEGYRFCPRLHVMLYGNRRGV
ncbi:MAG TPA: 7-carboxy-7-deazaguanine synthase QueE [Paludibaculum sp.]|jgi:7-carboxy-7-deazaguanine synthase